MAEVTDTLRFPLEVVLRVVTHMNHYTVARFLRALHEYRQFAVLVTDHRDIPFFFDVEDIVERKYLPVCRDTELPHQDYDGFLRKRAFTPDFAKHRPIRLFEVYDHRYYPWTNYLLVEPRDREQRKLGTIWDSSSWVRNPGLNCTSFLYLDFNNGTMDQIGHDAFFERIQLRSGCKFHCGQQAFVPQMARMRQGSRYDGRMRHEKALTLSHCLTTTSAPKNCTVIRLENIPVIADLTLLHLQELVIVYDKGVVDEPVIQGLVAPKICRFVVHYDRQLPIFRRMARLTVIKFRWETKWGIRGAKGKGAYNSSMGGYLHEIFRRFELCHIDSIGGYGGAASRDQCHQNPRKLIGMSFTFLKRFHFLILSGVPWLIVKQMNMSSLIDLYLTVSETAKSSELDGLIIRAPSLKNLSLTIKSDNIVIPTFETSVQPLYLSIRILAFNPNLNAFWQSLQPMGRWTLRIYNDPDLQRRARSNGKVVYSVSEDEWNQIEAKNRWGTSLGRKVPLEYKVSLVGFPDDG